MQTTTLPVLFSTLVLSLTPAPLHAQGPQNGPEPSGPHAPDAEGPTHALEAVRAGGPIVVDGSLGDAGWEGATHLGDFTQIIPQEGRPPLQPTEVRVAHDDTHLYVAFHALDDPSAVRATRGRRDRVLQDDLVMVSIDPRGTAEWAYAFGANPYGVQVDMRDHGMDQDAKLDLLYESAGRITEDGYVVEMAIPFATLRATPGERPWKINFVRMHPRQTRSVSSWIPVTRANPCILCQSGTIAGFEGVRETASWSLMPALVAAQSSARAEEGAPLHHGSVRSEPSLGASYRTAGGWSFEGTYNPDFSQVESDVAQIDVNSSLALSYPEKRPFFQAGAELFDTPLRSVYTRAINDPRAAAKAHGSAGAWQLGYLGAHDETSPLFVPLRERTLVGRAGASSSHVLRAKRSLGEGSYFGALLTDRTYEAGARGTTLGVDGVQRFSGGYALEYHLLGSRTGEASDGAFGGSDHTFSHGGRTYTAAHDGETFSGFGGRVALARNDRRTSLAASYDFATPTLQAANGFLRKNDYHDLEVSGGLRLQPGSGPVDELRPGLEVGREWTFGGEEQRVYFEPRFQVMLKGQTVVAAQHYHADETFRGRRFDGLDKITVAVQSHFSEQVGILAQVKYGDEVVRVTAEPALGRELSAVGRVTLKPTRQLSLEPRFAFARMRDARSGEEVYRGSISRLDASYQLTRELSVRLTGQYDTFRDRFDLDPLVTYQISPFSMFYVGSAHDLHPGADDGDWSLSERQVFLKFQYLFRR